MNDSLRLFVQKITKLPTIPAIAYEVLQLTSDDNASIGKLETIIQRDPAITAKIISFANSAFFGYIGASTTIGNAIQKIGVNNVRNIAMGVSLMTIFDNGKQKNVFDYERLYRHSMAVALTSKFLSEKLATGNPEEHFLSGMLHDLGYLLLSRFFPALYLKVLEKADKGLLRLDAEKLTLGFTHADIGAWLADKWNLPVAIRDTILHHHEPSLAEADVRQAALIHVADYIISKDFFPVFRKKSSCFLDPSSLDILGLSERELADIKSGINKDMFPEGLLAA